MTVGIKMPFRIKMPFGNHKNGALFTIDAILALLAVVSVVISAFVMLHNREYRSLGDEVVMSYDLLSVLEETKALHSMAELNDTFSASLFLDALPSQVCAKLTIFTQSNASVTSVKKSGCTGSDEFSIGRAVFITADKSIYYAEMKIWKNQTQSS